MATGATIEGIKAALVAAYQLINLPGGLGFPGAVGRELDMQPSSLPFVEAFDNPSRSYSQSQGEDSYTATRPFIVRLYVARLDKDTPSIAEPDRVKANNCVEVVTDYFYFTDDRLNTAFVTGNRIIADTASTDLFTRADRNYVGVAFEHLITYIRQR